MFYETELAYVSQNVHKACFSLVFEMSLPAAQRNSQTAGDELNKDLLYCCGLQIWFQ